MTNGSKNTKTFLSVETEKRKSEHIDICLHKDVDGKKVSTGFEQYRFRHQALPELNFDEIDLSTQWLGKALRVPYLISSMTGGTEAALRINRTLAMVAERNGWAMGLGSARAAVENEALAYTYAVREWAPTIPLLANIGAVQLNYGYGSEQCRRAVALTGADALILHLNTLQEVIQPEGDGNFAGLLKKIGTLCRELDVPVGVKEVGWGITGDTAERLWNAGVSFIDVAGAGGTSWSQVEKFRLRDPMRQQAAEVFAEWGVPTAACIQEVREQLPPHAVVIGSGGIQNGLEAAKAIALGADFVGYGKALLSAAAKDEGTLLQLMDRLELELKIAMFGIGAANIAALKQTDRLVYSAVRN